MVDADQADVRDLYRSSILRIPSYQRGYSWERRHVNDLLDDIDYLIEEEQQGQDGDFHYYGSVVLQALAVLICTLVEPRIRRASLIWVQFTTIAPILEFPENYCTAPTFVTY